MIEAKGLVKSFDGKAVLSGIDLTVEDNEIMVILGPSGQGKTVLIKTLVRLMAPDQGAVFYDGDDIFRMSRRKFRTVQRKIAYVFQDNALFDFLDVRDNLSLYLRMHTRMREDDILEEVLESIKFVGLHSDVLKKFPEELSGGMMKRVAIARAMIKKPCYFYYDEPTLGLDEGNVEKIVDLIVRLKKKICTTAVIVTHDIHLMWTVADRVALLKEGRILFKGRRKDLDEAMIHSLYESGED